MDKTAEFIKHYGVKGMKWGVRKDRKSRTSKSSARDAAKKLTDDELKVAISRMELEQRYANLLTSTSEKKQGSAFVQQAARNVANQAVSTVGNLAIQSAIKAATKKK